MTDFVLVGEAGVELKPKILPIFPMLLAMTPLTFAWDWISRGQKRKRPSAGGRTFTTTTQQSRGLLKGRSAVQGTPCCFPRQLFQPAGPPRGEDERPQGQALWGMLEKVFTAWASAPPAAPWLANMRQGLFFGTMWLAAPWRSAPSCPYMRTDLLVTPHGAPLAAALLQARPRYQLRWWRLPRAAATPRCTPTTTTNHRLLVPTPCPCPARLVGTDPAAGPTPALFNKRGPKTWARHCSRADWTPRLPTGNHAGHSLTPKVSLSPASVKAAWSGPKPCHHALFQQGESTDNSVQGPKILSQIMVGVTPMTLPSWIPTTQSLGASVPRLHLPLKGQWVAFIEPWQGPYRNLFSPHHQLATPHQRASLQEPNLT